MCKYCKLSLKDQVKLGLTLGYPKCCVKYFIYKKTIENEFQGLDRYNEERQMIMCDNCTVLYHTNKEMQLSKFKPKITIYKALNKLNILNPYLIN